MAIDCAKAVLEAMKGVTSPFKDLGRNMVEALAVFQRFGDSLLQLGANVGVDLGLDSGDRGSFMTYVRMPDIEVDGAVDLRAVDVAEAQERMSREIARVSGVPEEMMQPRTERVVHPDNDIYAREIMGSPEPLQISMEPVRPVAAPTYQFGWWRPEQHPVYENCRCVTPKFAVDPPKPYRTTTRGRKFDL